MGNERLSRNCSGVTRAIPHTRMSFATERAFTNKEQRILIIIRSHGVSLLAALHPAYIKQK